MTCFQLVQIWSKLHRWIHRCLFHRTIGPSGALGLAGPLVLFRLTLPRAPRVSHTLLLLPRDTVAPHLYAAAAALVLPLPLARPCSAAPPPLAHSSTAPAPRPHRTCATRAPPVLCRAAAHHRRQRTLYASSLSCSALSPTRVHTSPI